MSRLRSKAVALGVTLTLNTPLSAQGEYRAFLLKITRIPAAAAPSASGATTEKTATPPSTEQDFRLVKSNLDPEQYPSYYPLFADEKIQYIQTWMCRGRTNLDTDICDPPAPAQPTQSLDSKN